MEFIEELILTYPERYLDKEQQFPDYLTLDYLGGDDIIDINTTGMSYYDQFISPRWKEYIKTEKNMIGTIIMMAPEEYYDICAHKIFVNCSVERLKRERGEDDRETINKLHTVINVYKKKLCLPMIDYVNQCQEGLHRMLALAELFGWDHQFPVLTVSWYNKEEAMQKARDEQRYNIIRFVQLSISNTLKHGFDNKKEIEVFLQEELSRMFEHIIEITVPERIILEDTSDETYTFTFEDVKYVIEKSSIRSKKEVQEDIETYESESTIQRRQAARNQKLSKADEEILDIPSNIHHLKIDKQLIIRMLEERIFSCYHDVLILLEDLCECLLTYNIRSGYKGTTIYVNEYKLVTLYMRDGPGNSSQLYSYKLFI